MPEPDNAAQPPNSESASSPDKWSDRTKWVMGIVSALVIALLIPLISQLIPNGAENTVAYPVVNATLYNVVRDDKGNVVAAKEIESSTAEEIDTAMLENITSWISDELQLSGNVSTVAVNVSVPADWKSGSPRLIRTPDGPVEYFLRYIPIDDNDDAGRDSGKVRVPLSANSLESIAGLVDRCSLEIRVPGFTSRTVELIAGESIKEKLELRPTQVGIGVENFSGEVPGVADRIVAALTKHPRIQVMNPNALDRVREEIKAHNSDIDSNPFIQDMYRELGVDYILSGTVRLKRAGEVP